MKIVDVNPFFYPYKGGIEHRMHKLAKELASRGHDVTILTGQLPDTELEEESPDGYHIKRLPSKLYNVYNPPYISSKGVLEALNELDADIVNCNYRWAPSYNKAMRAYKGKKIYTCHNTWGEGCGWQKIPSSMNDRLFVRTLKTYDHVIIVTEFHRKSIVEHGIPDDKISVVNVCMDRYPDIENCPEGDFILSLGRLVKVKGLEYLIEAMKDVDCKLVMCGTGPEEENLKNLIRKNNLEDRIEMKGYVSEEEKFRLQSTCLFNVMPSIHDSCPTVAIEAMTYGRPIIHSDADGLPYTVQSGGIEVKCRDSAGLAKAMNQLLDDTELRRFLAVKAREVSETYNVHKVTDDLLSVFNKVLEE